VRRPPLRHQLVDQQGEVLGLAQEIGLVHGEQFNQPVQLGRIGAKHGQIRFGTGGAAQAHALVQALLEGPFPVVGEGEAASAQQQFLEGGQFGF